MEKSQQRTAMLAQLQGASDLAEQLHEAALVYLTERALDEARSKTFSSVPPAELVRLN